MTGQIIPVDFASSRAAREAREIRKIVRKADLTRAERDVLMVLVNLWFYHRSKGRDAMHPGKPKLAKRAKVCAETVKRALRLFRQIGVITALSDNLGGGRTATTYAVELDVIRELFDPHGVTERPGKLVQMPQAGETNVPPENAEMFPQTGGAMFPCKAANECEPEKKEEPQPEWTNTEGADRA